MFQLEGCTLREAEEWGELIIDACRLEDKVAMELTEVKETAKDDET